MTPYETITQQLESSPRTWLVTGAAGFIGSHLTEELLRLNQKVIALDNFSTGLKKNLESIQTLVGANKAKNLEFHENDILNFELCKELTSKVDYVLHQAALSSVPYSIEAPKATHDTNVTGFINMIRASQVAGVKKFVYASSSSVYGDHPQLPKVESDVGRVLSPYAASKKINEIYMDAFTMSYDIHCVGLRYFNIFGQRQTPDGPYAAVIPRWIQAIMNKKNITIFGDGKTSRDFCYIKNVIQANLLAATSENKESYGQVFNVSCGAKISLTDLAQIILKLMQESGADMSQTKVNYADFRPGDIRHSHANIDKINTMLNYTPTHHIEEGLKEAIAWYLENL